MPPPFSESGSGTLTDSTATQRRRKAANKPEKPYAEFTLFPRATGRWTRKIWAKRTTLGERATQTALKLYLDRRDDLHAGRQSTEACYIRRILDNASLPLKARFCCGSMSDFVTVVMVRLCHAFGHNLALASRLASFESQLLLNIGCLC